MRIRKKDIKTRIADIDKLLEDNEGLMDLMVISTEVIARNIEDGNLDNDDAKVFLNYSDDLCKLSQLNRNKTQLLAVLEELKRWYLI